MWGQLGRRLSGRARLIRSGRVHLGRLSALLAASYGERQAAQDLGDAPGFTGRLSWTAEALEDDVGRLAAGLALAGLGQGAVLVAVDNRVELLLHVLALARVGAIPAPIGAHLRPAEIQAVVEATGARGAVVGGALRSAVRDALPAGAPLVQVDGGGEGAFDLGAWWGDHPSTRIGPPKASDPEAVALYLTTSGTTGRPKAAALTSRGLLGGFGPLAALPLGMPVGPRGGRDALLAALPLAHVMGLAVALGCLVAGVPWLHRPRFEAARVLDDLEVQRPNAFVGVPTMYADLEAEGAESRDLSSVQLWISGADVMPLARARRFQAWGAAGRLLGQGVGAAAFLDGYGMVELSGPAAYRLLPPAPLLALSPVTPYKTLPGMQVRAVGEGGPLPWGRTGELQFRGRKVLRGYRGTSGAGPDAQGWFSTGDFGRTWPGGLFAFSGRHRDRLKVGGYSVFPAEVEAVLLTHPQVAEVALVGVADPRRGERPVAVVVAADGGIEAEAFLSWAEQQVSGYRRPREVVLVPAIPRGRNGKIDRPAATALATRQLQAQSGQQEGQVLA